MRAPNECDTMQDVRAGIDALDDQLVDLLVQRVRYVERAAELKPRFGIPADVPARVTEVLERVSARAQGTVLPPELAASLWRDLIAWSIAHEIKLMDETPAGHRPGTA